MLINSSTTKQFDSSALNNGNLPDELNENPLFDALKLVMTMRDQGERIKS